MNLLNKILEGDVRSAARLIRGIDDEAPDAAEELKNIYLHTGRAHIVGVTGAPGVGKSTLLGGLITAFRRKNMTVGVVAVDPTSPFSGGAILGDRLRMQGNGVDKDVFIRSLASRGWKGGLSKATLDTVHVMDAMGKDIVFVEAVGSGQAEVDIALVADTSIVVLTPGMGDTVQIMKAGILEVADVFVINKAEREGSDTLNRELKAMLAMKSPGGWMPSIVLTEAVLGRGIDHVAEEILRHREFLISSGGLEKRRRERARVELLMAMENILRTDIERMDKGSLEKLVDDLVQRKTSPRLAALEIIRPHRNS